MDKENFIDLHAHLISKIITIRNDGNNINITLIVFKRLKASIIILHANPETTPLKKIIGYTNINPNLMIPNTVIMPKTTIFCKIILKSMTLEFISESMDFNDSNAEKRYSDTELSVFELMLFATTNPETIAIIRTKTIIK